MPLKDFRVVSFDVAGTLIDFERGRPDDLRPAAPRSTLSDDGFLAASRCARNSADSTWYHDDPVRV